MYWIQDRLCGFGRVLQVWPQSVDVDSECCDEKNVWRRVQFEDKSRETTRP